MDLQELSDKLVAKPRNSFAVGHALEALAVFAQAMEGDELLALGMVLITAVSLAQKNDVNTFDALTVIEQKVAEAEIRRTDRKDMH